MFQRLIEENDFSGSDNQQNIFRVNVKERIIIIFTFFQILLFRRFSVKLAPKHQGSGISPVDLLRV